MIQHPARRLAWAATISTALLTGCFGNTAQEEVAAARASMAKGDRSAAIIQLKSALQKNTDMADARFLLARNLYESGNIPSAEIELDKAAKLGFSDTSIAPLRARLMLVRGERSKLVEQFSSKKLGGTAEQVDLMTTVAIALGDDKKYEPALKIVEAALAQDPANRRAQLVRVQCVRGLSGPEAAMRELEKLLAVDNKDSAAWQLKGEMLSALGKRDEAIAAYRQSITLRKQNFAARTALFALLVEKKDLDGAAEQVKELRSLAPKNLQTEFLAATLAFERNELKEANERIQRVLKVANDDPRAQALAANIDLKRGALLEADAHLGKLLASNPDNPSTRLLQAQVQLRLGNPAKAESILQPLLDVPEPTAEALSAAAEIHVQRGDTKAADEYLLQVVKRNPKDVSARVSLAMSAIRDGKVERGVADLKAIAASDRGVQAEMALISIAIQQKNYEQAMAQVDAIEKKIPGKASVRSMRGRIEGERGELDKARQNFEAALKIDARYYPAVAALVALDVSAGKLQAGIDRLQDFVRSEPAHMPAQLSLITLREKSGAKPEALNESLRELIARVPTDSSPRLALIEMQMRRKDNRAAMTTAQDATAALPDKPEVWTALGQLQTMSGDFDQAAAAFNKVISLRPSQPESYMPLARLYIARKDRPSAERTLARALSVKPGFMPAQIALLQLASDAGNVADALKIAKQVQAQQPQSPAGLIMAGDIEANRRAWDAAVDNYRAALAKGARTDVAIKLDVVLLTAKRDADSGKLEAQWLAAHPNDVDFLHHLGSVAITRNDLSSAESRFRAILKLNPTHAAAMNNLAWILNKTKKPGALEMAEKANALAPDQPQLMDTLAEIYAQAGQADKAIETQKKAIALAPENHGLRLNLARYYAAAGQKAAAREELKRLAALGDKLPQQAEVQKLLGTL